MNRDTFMTKLNSGIYDLAFTKLDGALRNMVATRNLNLIPSDQHPTSERAERDILGPVAVFDLEACGWRSVYPSSVISMNQHTTESV